MNTTETTTPDTTNEQPAATESTMPDAAALQAQIDELKDQHLRAQAEVQNARRRADEEVAKARKFGIENFAESLLPVLDCFEAGLAVSPAEARDRPRAATAAVIRDELEIAGSADRLGVSG